VWLSQTGRIELHATAPGSEPPAGSTFEAYLAVNGALAPLPIGSSFDAARGAFYWQPAPGFLGEFPIRIVRLEGGTPVEQWTTPVVISTGVDEVRLHIDPAPGAISGWALDPQAATGSGIGLVHVWARRLGSATAPAGEFFFAGQAALGLTRPEVAASHGAQFQHAGYQLALSPMSAGTYEFVVYAWSERTARWDAAQVITMTIGR